jgi:Domain of unknown function (DUF4440)
MKQLSALVLTVGLSLASIGCRSRENRAITQDELIRRTQELMDAVVPGDQEPWKKYFAEDTTYFDEKGRMMDKAALLKDVSPMPPGYSGAIKVQNAKSHILGDTAILSYDLDESETVFGQQLKARYHGTDTWIRRNGQWQIVAGQMLRYYEDPAPGNLDVAKVKPFLGIYELAPGTLREVTTDGKALFIERTGRARDMLIPEGTDIFFRRGVEGRILFRQGVNGQPDLLIDRRNNEDVVWKRVK